MPAEPTIDYETLAQDALRGLVRTVLTQTAKSGLPGEHHFYISFDTTATGVVLSKRLKEKYPHEMTIVLQHRFWDLVVQHDRFEVKLTFDGIPERLVVPFAAIKVFFDPSVRYGLQFEDPDLEPETSEDITEPFSGRSTSRGNGSRNTLRSTAEKAARPAQAQRRKAQDTCAGHTIGTVARSAKYARTGRDDNGRHVCVVYIQDGRNRRRREKTGRRRPQARQWRRTDRQPRRLPQKVSTAALKSRLLRPSP